MSWSVVVHPLSRGGQRTEFFPLVDDKSQAYVLFNNTCALYPENFVTLDRDGVVVYAHERHGHTF